LIISTVSILDLGLVATFNYSLVKSLFCESTHEKVPQTKRGNMIGEAVLSSYIS